MIKKSFYIFLTALLAAATVSAQQKTGRWTVFPTTSDNWANLVETPEKTYMHNGPSLFSLSDADNEIYVYNAYNKLTDRTGISLIRYNSEGEYLFIGYSNGNIDLLYDNGDVVNLAEIKDAVLSTGRNIHDVAFADGRIFVGADFGLVVYDDKQHRVIESGIYNKAVKHLMVLGEKLWFFIDGVPYVSNVTDKHNQLEKLTAFPQLYFTDVARISDNAFAYLHTSKAVYRAIPDYANNKVQVGALNITGVNKLFELEEGFYALESENIAIVDGEMNVSRVARPSGYEASDLYFNDLKSVWAATSKGVSRLDLSGTTPTVLMQPFMPDAINTTEPAKMKWSADGSKLYVSNYCYSFFLGSNMDDPHHTVTKVSCIDDRGIRGVSPLEVKLPTTSTDFDRISGEILKRQGIAGPYEYVPFGGGPTGLAVDPDDPDVYYSANLAGGIFVIKNGEIIAHLNSSNSPYPKAAWSEDVMGLEIDNEGNLWLACRVDAAGPYWYVLPSARRRDIKNVKKEDWVVMNMPDAFAGKRDIFSVFCRKSPYALHSSGGWNGGFTIQYTAGTQLDASDDRSIHFNSVTDQNGNNPNLTFTTCGAEDHDGHIWIGTGQGVMVIQNPAKVFDADFRVHRPIVARNDGTNLGDFLLESEQIQSIAVDAANRKWIASESSGVYLVSSDGSKILANYTAENSPLPSNNVYAVSCDPTGNKVYFGTSNGVACFDSDSSPAAEDYSDVYAYPNPVRPEYGGWITVAGLMDKSLVKIADAAGNVFFQGRSEGGMVSWDGCDASGNRVRSGVYFVFASQNESGQSSGVVTKILVIN